jgi:2-polyprenyl-3-methyl-5-hydroxy-6-metoxy-1,4-benzoquinol methylase
VRATSSAPPLGDWPADGLERVDRCPACASAERSLLYGGVTDRSYLCAAGRWNVFRCGECASAFLDPRPTKETVHLAYENYYEGAMGPAAVDEPRRLRHIRRAIRNGYLNGRYGYRLTPASRLGRLVVPLMPRKRQMADEHVRHLRSRPERPRLLDVGCGEGEFVAEMTKLGWAAEGIDPTVEAVAVARRAGVEVTQGDLADVAFDEDAFDAITFRLVFEHIPDPAAALRACHRALKRGGVLWIAAPNLDSEASRRFGDAWIFLEPPRHAVLYTPSSLMRLLRRYEIEPVAVRASGRAAWSFRLSRAIARGEPPFRKPRPLSLPEHARALLADVRGRVRPERADVVVIIGQKR